MIVIVVAVAAGVVVALTTGKKKATIPEANYGSGNSTQGEDEWGNRITYQGKQYRRNENLHTILFLGVDQDSESQWDDYDDPQAGVIGNAGRSDVIILFILDDSTQTTTMLTVSRDTMTNVDVYDMKGNFAYSAVMQITMQYAFGDSPSRSLNLTKRKVSELLYGIRIDGALSMTMDGIEKVVDMLGGIELTMPQDYSYIDSRYTEGATVKLNGEDMNHFIRYRDTDVTGSNDDRMARQTWLIGAVFAELKRTGAMSFLQEIIDSDPEWLETDCDAELLKLLSKYTISDVKYKVPGETVAGELHDEFYVDEAALQELIINLLYVPAE